MKHIVKGEEPLALIEFKNKGNTPDNAGWKPNWGDFRKPEKLIVHDTLLNEQGYICCYCSRLNDHQAILSILNREVFQRKKKN